MPNEVEENQENNEVAEETAVAEPAVPHVEQLPIGELPTEMQGGAMAGALVLCTLLAAVLWYGRMNCRMVVREHPRSYMKAQCGETRCIQGGTMAGGLVLSMMLAAVLWYGRTCWSWLHDFVTMHHICHLLRSACIFSVPWTTVTQDSLALRAETDPHSRQCCELEPVLDPALESQEPEEPLKQVVLGDTEQYGMVSEVATMYRTAKDGDSLFVALAHQLYETQHGSPQHIANIEELRRLVVNHLRAYAVRYRHLILESAASHGDRYSHLATDQDKVYTYLDDLATPGFHGGAEVLQAMADVARVHIAIYPEYSYRETVLSSEQASRTVAIGQRLAEDKEGTPRMFYGSIVHVRHY